MARRQNAADEIPWPKGGKQHAVPPVIQNNFMRHFPDWTKDSLPRYKHLVHAVLYDTVSCFHTLRYHGVLIDHARVLNDKTRAFNNSQGGSPHGMSMTAHAFVISDLRRSYYHSLNEFGYYVSFPDLHADLLRHPFCATHGMTESGAAMLLAMRDHVRRLVSVVDSRGHHLSSITVLSCLKPQKFVEQIVRSQLNRDGATGVNVYGENELLNTREWHSGHTPTEVSGIDDYVVALDSTE